MPFIGHGHYQDQADVFAYTAKCDGCLVVVRFTSAAKNPQDDLDDMDWIFEDEDCTRLLCSRCNPKATGNHTQIPAAILEAFAPPAAAASDAEGSGGR